MVDWDKSVREDTDHLRHSNYPLIRRIRELLWEKGIDPRTALLANIMPEGTGLTSGIVVTDARRVYEFEYSYRNRAHDEARFSLWRDVTDTYQLRAFHPAISTALAMLDRAPAAAGPERS